MTADVIWKLLEMRDTFRDRSYEALDAGPNVCAFMRGDDVVVVAPRLMTALVKPGVFPLGELWSAAGISGCAGRWKNVFTGDTIEGGALPLRQVFERFPVAVLERA